MRILKWIGIIFVSFFFFVWVIAACFYYFNDDIRFHFDNNINLIFYNSDLIGYQEKSTKYEISEETTELNLLNEIPRYSIKINDDIFWIALDKEYRIKIIANNGYIIPGSVDRKTNIHKRNIFTPKIFVEMFNIGSYFLMSEWYDFLNYGDTQVPLSCMYITKYSNKVLWDKDCFNLIIPEFNIDWDNYIDVVGYGNFSIERELFFDKEN